jgi:uncharacterized protein YjbI with pentapeptide repeats
VLIAKHMLLEYPDDYHLEGVDMSGTDLSEADLSSVQILDDVLSLKDTDLRGVTGLTRKRLKALKDEKGFH